MPSHEKVEIWKRSMTNVRRRKEGTARVARNAFAGEGFGDEEGDTAVLVGGCVVDGEASFWLEMSGRDVDSLCRLSIESRASSNVYLLDSSSCSAK